MAGHSLESSSICLELLERPTELPCRHVFSLKHLKEIVNTDTCQLKCPDCHTNHHVPNADVSVFPKDNPLEEHIELETAKDELLKAPGIDYNVEFKVVKEIQEGEAEELINPNGVTVCPVTDNMYITYNAGNSVAHKGWICEYGEPELDTESRSQSELRRKVETDYYPDGISIDHTRRLIVTVLHSTTVHIYNNENLEIVKTFNTVPKDEDSMSQRNGGVTCDSDSNLYITDCVNSCIKVFNPNGELMKIIKAGILLSPMWAQITKEDKLLVTDTHHRRVFIFNLQGEHEGYLGETVLRNPYGISVDAQGYILVADFRKKWIQVFTSKFQHHATIRDDAGAAFDGIDGISINKNGKLFVTNCKKRKLFILSQ